MLEIPLRNNNPSFIREKIMHVLLFISIFLIWGSNSMGQYHATISFNWSNIDSNIKRISVGNSSDFYWREPLPIRQYTDDRSEKKNITEWRINLSAPIQQVKIYIIGVTYNMLLADGDSLNLKIQKQEDKGKLELDIISQDKKRILFFEALNTYLTNLNYSSNTINQIPKNEVLSYLSDISNKSEVFVNNYFNNENEPFRNVARKHIEAMVLNRIFYFKNSIVLPSWVHLSDTTTEIQKLDAVTELLKNYGNKLFQLFDENKDTAILSQHTEGLKKPFRDYALIVVVDKILTETPNELTKSAVEQLLGNIEDSTHQVYTSKMLAKNFILGKPLPDSVSSQTFLLPLKSKRAISFSEMLSNYKEELVVIDFWASWCGACRLDMQDAVDTKKYLDSLKIKVVYFSCDREKDLNKWIQASKVEGVTKNQFLVTDNFSSPLIKYLNVNYIPRYILFKRGKLVNIVFPRLTDKSLNDVRKEIEKIMMES